MTYIVRKTELTDIENVVDADETYIGVPQWTATDEVGLRQTYANTPVEALEAFIIAFGDEQ